jgi:hypothetical protein
VLAVSTGALFSYENGALVHRGTYAGARSRSPDGQTVLLAGSGILRSTDGGHNFRRSWSTRRSPSKTFGSAMKETQSQSARRARYHRSTGGAVSVQRVGTATLHTLHIADLDSTDAVGYAAGDGGQVLLTFDGGATWTLGPNLGRTVFGVDEIGEGHR